MPIRPTITAHVITTVLVAVLAVGLPVAAGAADASQGRFVGASGHATSGTVTIEPDGDGHIIRLHDDFSLDGAPDPWVSLGAGGDHNAVQIEVLGRTSGAQRYRVPAGTNLDAIDRVVIYCVRYSVPLGIAVLE